jgi:predicted phage terminase large subunit-like protein
MNCVKWVSLLLNFTPSKGNDKHTRVNSVAPLFESGQNLWAPVDMEFAQEVIEECAAFPYGDHDDLSGFYDSGRDAF